MDEEYLTNFEDGPFVFRLNDNGTGPSLLIQVCLERGWRGYQPEMSEKWNLWWRGGLPAMHRRSLHAWQFINHIPKGSSICKKDNLARHLKCMKKVYGSIYDFSPHGYHLPLEYAKLAAECSKNRSKSFSKEDEFSDSNEVNELNQKIWICKPVGQSQGRGIYLFRRLSDLTCDSNSVVQRYIERPLLIGGYKFDLRLYVCITTYHPLTVYLYKEGLARFSTDKFSLTDLQNPFRHLTNSSLNKFGPKYAECKDRIGSGCKWTLRQVRRYMNQSGVGSGRGWRLWQRVAALVVLTALAQAAGIPPSRNCFEFFGFDVLVDADLRPWLLEVNLSPALANDCDADEIVKKPLLHDLFDLLGLPMCNTGLSLFTVWSKDRSKENAVLGSCSDEDSENSEQVPDKFKENSQWNKRTEAHIVPRTKFKHGRPGSGRSHRSSLHTKPSPSRKQTRPIPAITLSFPPKYVQQPMEPLTDETWGRYSVIKKCDQKQRKCAAPLPTPWGNGRDWSAAPNSIGGWTKVFPLESLPFMRNDGISNAFTNKFQCLDKTARKKSEREKPHTQFSLFDFIVFAFLSSDPNFKENKKRMQTDYDIRTAVGNIARYNKATRLIERQYPDADDDQLNEALRKELQYHIQIWLPDK
ncbi:putative tubulin polyglutamylase TTLL2 [Arctopsyche grandis]|uniref:putative tubulin polyglutamylase TTLL2 n=1 Tax=Arctopsyche grandis TaxID=121162 RepID=UPI00406D9F8D